MSGTLRGLRRSPTLVSFAVTTADSKDVISPEFKRQVTRLFALPQKWTKIIFLKLTLFAVINKVTELMRDGRVYSAYTPTMGGIAEAVMKMTMGNGFGFKFEESLTNDAIFGYDYASFLLEVDADADFGEVIGFVTEDGAFTKGTEAVATAEIDKLYEDKLESVYSCNIKHEKKDIPAFEYKTDIKLAPAIKVAKPKVIIPAFPGTNCEYDSAKAMMDAGAEAEIIVVKNLTANAIAESVEYFAERVKDAQMIFIPGGFSGGDEPDGSAKFITAFFRNAAVKEAVTDLL